MESFRRNMKISIPESDNINSLHFPVILGAHATTIINQKGIIDSSKNIGSEWEKKLIESLVANQINDFLMNPHHIHGFSETHEVATNNTATPATSTATNINSKPAVTSNFPNSSSGISRPISLKPVVDTSMANYPSGFQSTASSPSNPSRGEFKPKETGSFQSSPLSGGSRGMTGRNRRRQLIVECRRLRSEIGKFEDEFTAINQRAPKPTEHGSMQSAYAQYKNLKRIVRDEAATDIQRVFRGMLVRVAVGFTIRKTAKNDASSASVSAFGGDRTYSPSPRRQLQSQTLQKERSQSNTLASFSPTRHTRPRDIDDETGVRHQSARRDDGDVIGISSIDMTSVKDSTFEIASPSKRKVLNKIATTSTATTTATDGEQQEGSPPHISTLAMSPIARHTFGSSDTFDLASTSFDHADSHTGGSVGSAETGALSTHQHQQRKRKGADVRSPSTSSVVDWLQSPVAISLKADYRDLLTQKNSLKSLLKRFDDEFKSVHGRLPIRKEKEKMRFTYEKYHEIKAAISKVRQELETGYCGPLSDDLLNEDSPRERVKRGFTAQSPTSVGNSYHESTALTGGSSALTPIDLNVPIGRSRANSFDSSISFDTRLSAVTGVLGDEDASLSLRLSDFEESLAAAGVGASAGSVHTGTNVGVGVGVGVAAAKSSGILPMSIPASPSTPFVSIGTNMSTSPTTTPHQQQQQHTAVGGGHVSSNISTGANQPVSGGTMNTFIVTELQDEKLRLLATLKSFEREFTKRHGRPVTKHEDIAPVSTEYKRYKEIKAILHES